MRRRTTFALVEARVPLSVTCTLRWQSFWPGQGLVCVRGRPTPPDGERELDAPADPAYSGAVMGGIRYTTDGSLRGRCGHQHKTIEKAAQCLDDDEAWCRAQGADGHTDRRIVVIDSRKRRELNDDERAAVEAYRTASKSV